MWLGNPAGVAASPGSFTNSLAFPLTLHRPHCACVPVSLCPPQASCSRPVLLSLCRLAVRGRGLLGCLPRLPPPGHLLVSVLSPHLLLLCPVPLLPGQVLLPGGA